MRTKLAVPLLAIALAFVVGTMITGTMANAASNAQGQPFQALQEQVDLLIIAIEDQIPPILILIDEERDDRVERDVLLSNIDVVLAIDREAGDAFLQSQIDVLICKETCFDTSLECLDIGLCTHGDILSCRLLCDDP